MNVLSLTTGVVAYWFKNTKKNNINISNEDLYNDIQSKIKFISKIEAHQKINVRGLFTQPENYYTILSRTIFNTCDRYETFEFLNYIVNKCFEIIELKHKSELIIDKEYCKNLMKDIFLSKRGIVNLIKTYFDDKIYCCKLETILENINTKMLYYHQINKDLFTYINSQDFYKLKVYNNFNIDDLKLNQYDVIQY